MSEYRTESDSMGQMQVPAEAMYGASTARAVENFPVSTLRFPREFIKALGHIKQAAASVNLGLGRLPKNRAELIRKATAEMIEGKWDDQFVLDIFQTGSGTSTNMNANEVLAHRCAQLSSKVSVHPNDDINMGQSSNDVIPTAIHLAATDLLLADLIPALKQLHVELVKKAKANDTVIKIGRTHLMDATPITLGQEISGWARQVELGIQRLESCLPRITELAQGGTAVGTGLNTHAEFGARIAMQLSRDYGIKFNEASNHFEAQAAQDAAVELSGQLKTVAVSLVKVANDVRLLNAGPRCGLGEITVPSVQPGSSIMPGKVNPVIAESLAQVCAQVIGNDAAISFAGASGLLDLNVMLPVIAHNLLESERLLASASRMFAEKCIEGLTANTERCAEQIEWSMSMVTSLAPVIGYDRASKIAKQAVAEGKTVRQLCEEQDVMPLADLKRLLDPATMLHPNR
ncbi:class II fumarate hydratase [Mariprofundus ferrooxydans]|uniref:Fumarate hydratase class II n=1 Tax=Mariprofundus ferrooxydans PV-1 TaxID=314345 RepID=Q0F3S5_9PROT|nr:class II fumarate hydratase [Mariprofundus ferrooxydans]EAU55866.1 fumarate hydratase [Mariprofundus ferrooxydans PV-1]KON48148.1 aspartate ammonia-lyase [Mariprofundus ferrooxydans]